MNAYRSIVALALLALPTTAVAQDAVPLSLDEAIARATDTSHRLAEIRARGKGAQAVVRQRQVADLPFVTLSGGYTRTNHVEEFGVVQPGGLQRVIYPDVPDNVRTRLELAWPIYNGGRTDALERVATAEAQAVEADLAVARLDLRLEVVRAYWALVTADESVRVVDGALQRADAHLADVRQRFDVGLLPPNDVSNVEAQRSRQQMLVIEARNLRESAATDLRRLVGLELDQPMTLTETLGRATPPPSDPLTLVGEAIDQRPERQALVHRLDGALAREAAAAGAALPELALAGGVDYARPNPRIFPRREVWEESWDVSVNVSWSLWDGGRTAAAVEEASASVSAARAGLNELDRLVSSDVRQRLLDLDSSRAAIASAEDAVRAASESQRVASDRFGVGVGTSTEVLDAQLVLLQAELDLTRARANVRLAEARLERALGRASETQ